ncbi:hypothetical protein [Haloechinothrix sp. LS1_15]|uniref:hypothetical protein n=1 Tax=Haloechinothrix sp. LS1_15 TaxID=2652248 RepID=UPI00294AC5CE|nr:hypothetical protein [Haloechinothrix sp. LS1_15]
MPGSSDTARTSGAVGWLSSLPGVSTASTLPTGQDQGTGTVLPVPPALESALPSGGLRRGSTVSVRGSRALLFTLLAEATTRGSWAAVVGMPDIGVAAAAELGVDVRRLAVVPAPGTEILPVVGALLDGVDLVVLGGGLPARQSLPRRQTERLLARARQRGAVLLTEGPVPGAELELHCLSRRWQGLEEQGGTVHVGCAPGYLRECELTVRGSGRRAAARPQDVHVLLPGPGGGAVAPAVSHDVPVRELVAG